MHADARVGDPLTLAHIPLRLLGRRGTTPGRNFLYVHRLIKAHDLDRMNIIGPGHGGPGRAANTCLEGACTEIYPGRECAKGRASSPDSSRGPVLWPGGIQSTGTGNDRVRSTKAASRAIRWRTTKARHSRVTT
ncbi:MAG: hypothetical protein M3Q40_09370 [Pseudomonadota bacterium]|nr:hypothetical protein [Pseudomonadota bacterium]